MSDYRTTNGMIPGWTPPTVPDEEIVAEVQMSDELARRVRGHWVRRPPRWPDRVIELCNVAFLVAMWPTLTGPDKPALATSVGTGAALLAVALAVRRLGAVRGAIAVGLLALAWLWVAGQTLGCLP